MKAEASVRGNVLMFVTTFCQHFWTWVARTLISRTLFQSGMMIGKPTIPFRTTVFGWTYNYRMFLKPSSS